MLPVNTSLGQLDIFEVYEYLDGPRLFGARNNIGTMFLVFWCDEEDNATGWLYLPISEARLNELRRKEITLNAAFREPETNYYLVYTGISPQGDTAKPVNLNEIDAEFFPPENFYIEHVDVVNEKTDDWCFETILDGRAPSADGLSQFVGRFRELVEDVIGRITDNSIQRLYAQGALVGSVKLKFSADSDHDAIEALKIVGQLIHADDLETLRSLLLQWKINSSLLRDFLTSILRNKLDVTVEPKLASDGGAIEFPKERIERCLRYLDDTYHITVDSIKVPQANDIDKVLEIVELIDDGIPLIPENIEELTTPRQVKYYVDAAYALGLITRDKQLTTAGHFTNSRTTKNAKYEILADRFESTDFGWAWMTWAQVQYMTELDPETAADFLIASVPQLSEITARRRASTLRKWLSDLQPYHRKYGSDETIRTARAR